jgi:hypothetical protein
MATPKGQRCGVIAISTGDAVHVYSGATKVVLQLRRAVPTIDDLAAPSYKIAAVLDGAEALSVAAELLRAASALVRENGALVAARKPADYSVAPGTHHA